MSIQKWKKKRKKNWINSSTSSLVVFAKILKANNSLMFKQFISSTMKKRRRKRNWVNSSISSRVVLAKRLKANNTSMFKDLWLVSNSNSFD